jgi:uncharacterized protein YebE (UPF0316 family)
MEWYIPILVFFARILDVSIGTVRIIFVMKGSKLSAAVMGFFEVTIWVLAVSAVIGAVKESWITLIAYGLGFATGTLVGMWLEEKIALGKQLIRIVNIDQTRSVSDFVRERNYIVTRIDGYGGSGPAEISFVITSRRKADELIREIAKFAPDAYITVEDIRTEKHAHEFPIGNASRLPPWKRWIKMR